MLQFDLLAFGTDDVLRAGLESPRRRRVALVPQLEHLTKTALGRQTYRCDYDEA